MSLSFSSACGSFIGNDRESNEDNFYFNKKRLPNTNKGLKNPLQFDTTTTDPVLFAVFDGLGGESRGEDAAYLACEIFAKEYKSLEEIALSGKEFMLKTCEKANKKIIELAQDNQLTAMGTTVAALYISSAEVVACNMGDSKIFRIRDKEMVQISQDHTDEKIMKAIGVSKKPVLLQYLGVSDELMSIDPYITKGEVQKDDIYILSSDGVTDAISLSDLYNLALKYEPKEAVQQILALVDKQNGADNATLIIIKIL